MSRRPGRMCGTTSTERRQTAGAAGNGNSLLADLRAAAPAVLRVMQVSMGFLEYASEVVARDLHVEEALELSTGDDDKDSLGVSPIAIIAVGLAALDTAVVWYVCCCRRPESPRHAKGSKQESAPSSTGRDKASNGT